MSRRFGVLVPLVLALFLALSGCMTSTSRRGTVDFGRMQVLTQVSRPPRPAEVPDVRYPEVLLAQGIEGSAEVSFTVDPFGDTRDVTVVAASLPEFGEAAVASIRRLRYVPAARGVSRVPCAVVLTIFFRIE